MIHPVFSILLLLTSQFNKIQASIDPKSYLVKNAATLMIENDGNTPMTHYLIDCDETNGHSRLSHITAELSNEPMPVSRSEDGKMWRVDLSSNPIEPGVVTPLRVTKIYTHLELVPSHDVYLMPYSSIQYQVRIFRQGRLQKVKVPTEQYYLVVDNRELVDLEESTALALESEGSTKIRFVDKNVISDEDFIQPESNIHIVKPSYLTMHVTPGGTWALQEFTDYTIEIRLFDENHHQIYHSDDLDIQLSPGTKLVITNSTLNGTHHTIHTLNSGSTQLVARLMGTTHTLYSFDEPIKEISLTQELSIYETIAVLPQAVLLPWLPEQKPSYEIKFYASGGTGSYLWTSANSISIHDISIESVAARITATEEGTTSIKCTDSRHPSFHKDVFITVTNIEHLEILPSIREAEVGGEIIIPVAVYGNSSSGQKLFDDCSKIKFDLEMDDIISQDLQSKNLNTGSTLNSNSCTSLKFTCKRPGSSHLWISYRNPSTNSIGAYAQIACYMPLKLRDLGSVGVIAVHTSIDVYFTGGPRPIEHNNYYSNLEPIKDSIVSVKPVSENHDDQVYSFRVYCNEYGEELITLKVGNQPSVEFPEPVWTQASVKIACARPDSIQLVPRLKNTCSLGTNATVPVSISKATWFELILFDDHNRRFLNTSSFQVDISLTSLGKGRMRSGAEESWKSFIIVEPNGGKGIDTLRANLRQYKDRWPNGSQAFDLTANVHLKFVDHVNTSSKVFIHNEIGIAVLPILQGSGDFSVKLLQGAEHVRVSYELVSGQHRVYVTPLSDGDFFVRIDDQCIESSQTMEGHVVGAEAFEAKEVIRVDQRACVPPEPIIIREYIRQEPSVSPDVVASRETSILKANVVREPSILFDNNAQSETNVPREAGYVLQKTGVLQRMLGTMILVVLTASAFLSYRWWQEKKRRPANQLSFVQQSPSHRSNVSFSPSSSRGPTSSTPRPRPLFTEKFSTTLSSD